MRLGSADPGKDFGVAQASRVVTNIGVRIQRRAQLPECPPFDEDDLGLRDVAASQLVQQLPGSDAGLNFVAAGLDAVRLAGQAPEQRYLPGPKTEPGAGHLRRGGTQAEARPNLEGTRPASRHMPPRQTRQPETDEGRSA